MWCRSWPRVVQPYLCSSLRTKGTGRARCESVAGPETGTSSRTLFLLVHRLALCPSIDRTRKKALGGATYLARPLGQVLNLDRWWYLSGPGAATRRIPSGCSLVFCMLGFLVAIFELLPKLAPQSRFVANLYQQLRCRVSSHVELRGSAQLRACRPTHTLALTCSVSMFFAHFIRAWQTHPGPVERWSPVLLRASGAHLRDNVGDSEQPPPTCSQGACAGAPKLARVHHCRACGRCSLRMDHHCVWIDNCVGWHNHKFFLNLIFFQVKSMNA